MSLHFLGQSWWYSWAGTMLVVSQMGHSSSLLSCTPKCTAPSGNINFWHHTWKMLFSLLTGSFSGDFLVYFFPLIPSSVVQTQPYPCRSEVEQAGGVVCVRAAVHLPLTSDPGGSAFFHFSFPSAVSSCAETFCSWIPVWLCNKPMNY